MAGTDELIDNLVDRGKVKSDIDYVTELLEKVFGNIEKINKIKIDLGGAKGMADAAKHAQDAAKAAEDLAKANAKVAQANAEMEKTLRGINSVWDAANADVKENIKLQAQYESELKKLKTALNDLQKAGGDSSKIVEYKYRIVELKAAIGDLDKTIKSQIGADKVAAEGAKAAEDATAKNKKLKESHEEVEKSLQGVNKEWHANAADIKDNLRLQIQYQSELGKVQGLLVKAQEEGDLDKTVDYKQRILELKAAISELDIVTKNQAKSNISLETTYKRMSLELGNMRALNKSLTEQERDTPYGKQLAKNIDTLDAEVKKLDATMGIHARNVGNYKSGFNGLNVSISQIMRELPAFTFSMQTGFLGISNNLPMLFDEIGKVSAQVKALRAEGQKVPGVFAQIVKNLLSVQSALNVGVLLLTLYGDKVFTWIGSLFKGEQAARTLADAQADVNKELTSGGSGYQTAVEDISRLEQTIKLARGGVISKTEALKQFNDKIHLTTGEVKSLDEAEQFLVDHKEDYLKMMLQKAVATVAYQKAAEKAIEQIEINNKKANEFIDAGDQATTYFGSLSSAPGYTGQLNLSNQKQIEQLDKIAFARRKKLKDDAAKEQDLMTQIGNNALTLSAELAQKIGVSFSDDKTGKGKKDKQDKIFEQGDAIRKAQYELQKLSLEDQKRLNDEIVKNDEAAFLQRTEAAKKYLAATQALNKLEYDYKIADINAKEQNDLASAQNDYKNVLERQKAITYITGAAEAERNLAKQKFNSDSQKIDDDYRNDYLQKLADFLKKDQEARQKHQDELQKLEEGELKVDYEGQLAELDQAFADKLISEKDYNKERLRLQLQYQASLLKIQIDAAREELAIAEAVAEANGDEEAFNKVRASKIKLADLQNKLTAIVADFQIKSSKKVTEEESEQLKKRRENLEKAANDISKIAGGYIQGLSAVADLFNAQSERELNRLQEQIDLINKKRKAEIDAIEATTLSEQEKAAKISIINAKADAEQQQIELRQRQQKQRQARFDKAIAIATIIQETAVAVVKALAVGGFKGIAAAVAVGAIGAVKLAAAIATPIPAYAEGTEGHKGGLAYVGDGGRRELVVTPSGKSFITPDKSTLVNLPKGTKVFPDAAEIIETAKYAAFKTVPQDISSESDYTAHMISDLSGRIEKLTDVVRNKREIHLTNTRAGMNARWKEGFNIQQWLSENFH